MLSRCYELWEEGGGGQSRSPWLWPPVLQSESAGRAGALNVATPAPGDTSSVGVCPRGYAGLRKGKGSIVGGFFYI